MTTPPAGEEVTLSAAALYEGAPCGLLVTRANGSIETVNRTLCDWLGFSAEELAGKKRLQDLLTIGCKIFHQTHWLPLLQIQGSVAEVQLELVHHDGHAVPVLVNAARRSEGGVVRDHLAIFVATDRRKYERELLLARKRAEELLESERAAQTALAAALRDKEQDAEQRVLVAEQLLGIVSHDLRTPLNAVLLGAGLLAAHAVSDAQARTIERIKSSANRASRLIADLLDFTQARLGGGLRMSVRELDLHGLAADCVEELRLAWPARLLEHRRDGDVLGHADADRIAQVISNLVSNAMAYGDAGRPVTVTSSTSAEALGITVHNFGPVIPEALLPHLFEAMRRGEQQVKLGSRSVGLGLYIVQQIAVAHGGDVQVRSSEGEGTSFDFSIPMHALVRHAQ